MSTRTCVGIAIAKSGTRHLQWEIADSLCSYLQNSTGFIGRAREIVLLCNIRADGNSVAKFLGAA